jgi:hypothetical protein
MLGCTSCVCQCVVVVESYLCSAIDTSQCGWSSKTVVVVVGGAYRFAVSEELVVAVADGVTPFSASTCSIGSTRS